MAYILSDMWGNERYNKVKTFRGLVFQKFKENLPKKGVRIHNILDDCSSLNDIIDSFSESNFILFRRHILTDSRSYYETLLMEIYDYKKASFFGRIGKIMKDAYEYLVDKFSRKTHRINTEKNDLGDKLNAAKLAKRLGIPSPKTLEAKKYKGNFKFPLIIKKRRAGMCRGNLAFFDEYQIEDFFEKTKKSEYIIQEYIETPSSKKRGISSFIRVMTFGSKSNNLCNLIGVSLNYNPDDSIFGNLDGVEKSIALTGKNSKRRLTKFEEEIIYLNGLKRGELPTEMLEQACLINAEAAKQGSQIITSDWIFDGKRYLFLGDINKRPGLETIVGLEGDINMSERERISLIGKVLADNFKRCF